MSDRLRPLPPAVVAAWIDGELERTDSIFGIPRRLGFCPSPDDRFRTGGLGTSLETPVGVAAGPHTQLAQNIVAAWLCGARVIELKTVQTRDTIAVAKPCIDMPDEGYNIEWSQELTVAESVEQYLTAWLLVQALHVRFGFPGRSPGVAFDISVGYDLEGLKRANMRGFLESMTRSGTALRRCRDAIIRWFPELNDLDISAPPAISATVSTLHGCPPEDIGAMVEHLMETWGLHAAVKLNPTLLGLATVHAILVDELGWTDLEPHRSSFEVDIGYGDAVDLLDGLDRRARELGLGFGIKLCNTLPVVNRRPVFAGRETVAYLSGRPLHALAVELARRLTADLPSQPAISFAGGADAFNTPFLLAAGLRPVTACTDLLRVGGTLRLRQYLDEIDAALDRAGASDLDDLIVRTAGGGTTPAAAALLNLDRYADRLRGHPAVAASGRHRDPSTKTARPLGPFDCVEAPCTTACGIDQRVPAYMRHVAAMELDAAAEVIARDNPLPSILGRACHHPCEPVCIRGHLDEPLAIREIKRFVTDHAQAAALARTEARKREIGVAIVGAGPCGLGAAVELARAGLRPVVFEARREGGGMVSATIPGYRANPLAVRRDLDAIAALGVRIELGTRVGADVALEDLIESRFRHVIVAAGAQHGRRLGIPGEDADGVLDGLEFLRAVRQASPPPLGRRIAVIGGGDVAIDCARSARRLSGGEVEILYRRTVAQMPAHPEEIAELAAEGISIRELVAPRRIVAGGGRVEAVECAIMVLGEVDASGRRRPVEGAWGPIELAADTLIVAIGQRTDLDVFGPHAPETDPMGFVVTDPTTFETSIPRVYVGGDLRAPGPSSIVDACADGRRIARSILRREGIASTEESIETARVADSVELLRRRSRRRPRVATPRASAEVEGGFDEIVLTLAPESAVAEAARCLDCDLLCSICELVCPNRAIVGYRHLGLDLPVAGVVGEPASLPDLAGVHQEPQVAVIADLCNECGNCTTFCPTAGQPWRDKPRLYLHRADFEAESDNAFMLVSIAGRTAIQARFEGQTHQLSTDPTLHYVGPTLVARLDPETLEILELRNGIGSADSASAALERCATMWVLLRGLGASLPHLPVTEAAAGWLVPPPATTGPR